MSKPIYYHASFDHLDVGTVLRVGDGERSWVDSEFNKVLEHYRPSHLISRNTAVFLSSSPEDADASGAHTEWLFIVQPIGDVVACDLNWATEIDLALDAGASEDRLRGLAQNYWSGKRTGAAVMEYLVESAIILSVEEF